MPCWNKENGSNIVKSDDGGDGVFGHVRDLKDGEGSVDGGNTAKPKSLLRGHVGHISHSDNEADLRATSSTSSSTLHDGETWKRAVDHLSVKALWCQEHLLDLAESDTKTLSADRIVHPTRRRRTRTMWQAGNGLRTGGAGERGVVHETTRGGSGTCG